VPEFRFDAKRRWRADWGWPDVLLLEIEGGTWLAKHGKKSRHFHGKGIVNDMAKYNRAAELGYRVIRCTPEQFASGSILATIEACLGVE
jgi:hypothetical protein